MLTSVNSSTHTVLITDEMLAVCFVSCSLDSSLSQFGDLPIMLAISCFKVSCHDSHATKNASVISYDFRRIKRPRQNRRTKKHSHFKRSLRHESLSEQNEYFTSAKEEWDVCIIFLVFRTEVSSRLKLSFEFEWFGRSIEKAREKKPLDDRLV